MITCPHCDKEFEENSESYPRVTYRRSMLDPRYWLVGEQRIKDALIDELALGVIYFELIGSEADVYLGEQIQERIPTAYCYNTTELIYIITKNRIRELKEKQ